MDETLLLRLILVYGVSFFVGCIACCIGLFAGDTEYPKLNHAVARVIWWSVFVMIFSGAGALFVALDHYL